MQLEYSHWLLQIASPMFFSKYLYYTFPCIFAPLAATCSQWEPASSSKWTDPETETNVRGEET